MAKQTEAKKAKKAIGKTAGRAKVVEVRRECPECIGHRFLIPVHFYPERGKGVNAWGCPLCKQVYRVFYGGWTVLAKGVAL